MSAELAARRTAAAAVLADFMHAISAGAWDKPPDFMAWSLRLRDHLVQVLDGLDADEAADDGTEPYCTTCGAWAGMFHGVDGWQHFRGDPAPGGVRELYDAEHGAAIGWMVPAGRVLSPADVRTVLDGLDLAADELRDRAASCADCPHEAGGLCTTCDSRLSRASDYDATAARLWGGAR